MYILEPMVGNLLRIWVLVWINLKMVQKVRFLRIEWYVGEIDDNAKQFAIELNKLPTSEDNQGNIMLQDIINKNEIAADSSIKLIETH